MFITIIYLGVAILLIASLWKLFQKAGAPGWAAIVPIYNYYIMIQMAGKPVWWIILLLIPFVNIIVSIIVMMEIAKNFGKTPGFGVGMALLSIVFIPMLAFSDSEYSGPALKA